MDSNPGPSCCEATVLTTGVNLIEELGHLFWLIIMSIFINLGHRMFQNRGLLFGQTFRHIQFFFKRKLTC